MKNTLFVAVSLCFVTLQAARADVLSERVVLEVTGVSCPNGNAKEVRPVPLMADGKLVNNNYGPYVIPSGWALEITDLTFTLGSLKTNYLQQITVAAQNRSTQSLAALYSYQVRPWSFRTINSDNLHLPLNASQFVSPMGTVHVPFESGLLVSSEARVCVQLPSDLQIFEAGTRILLRGKIHKVDTVVVGTDNTGFKNNVFFAQ